MVQQRERGRGSSSIEGPTLQGWRTAPASETQQKEEMPSNSAEI